jgi:hypothetical protein
LVLGIKRHGEFYDEIGRGRYHEKKKVEFKTDFTEVEVLLLSSNGKPHCSLSPVFMIQNERIRPRHPPKASVEYTTSIHFWGREESGSRD